MFRVRLHFRLVDCSVNSVDQTSEDYLATNEDEWNKKVDSEAEILVDGMVDLVGLALIGDKDVFCIAQESFQVESRAESMIRAANSLLSITHSLKLLLLLFDEAQIVHRRDAERKAVQEEGDDSQTKVAALLDELLRKPTTSDGTSAGSSATASSVNIRKE